MNHIGNANKMVSETPISDSTPHNVADLGMQIRRLERQLTAANSKIELLMSANADVARIAGERDAAEKRIKRLEAVVNDPHALWANWLRGDVKLPEGIGDVRQYQDRIKRLHEALERLFNLPNDCCCQLSNSSLDAWNNAHEALKAMEAKP